MRAFMVMCGAAVAVNLSGCAQDDPVLRTYDNNELELGASYAAFEACNCLLGMEMDRAYCDDFIRVNPEIGRISVDTKTKVVTGHVLMSWTARPLGGRQAWVCPRVASHAPSTCERCAGDEALRHVATLARSKGVRS